MGSFFSQQNKSSLLMTGGGIFLISSFLFYKPLIRKLSLAMLIYARQLIKANRPKRIILVRHGQSEANLDHKIYTHTPDNRISLTEKGKQQAKEASAFLKEIIGKESIKFMVSPYERGIQTYEILKSAFINNVILTHIDPRLREQEFGNFRDKDPSVVDKLFDERRKVGKFFYRFLNGESGADVYDRANNVLDYIFRSIDDIEKFQHENIVLVCHGLFMRLFIMRFFKMSIEKFDLLANPNNCDIWVIEKNSQGIYEMKSELIEDPTYSD
jgi:broad specificity phosphatase PhoE